VESLVESEELETRTKLKKEIIDLEYLIEDLELYIKNNSSNIAWKKTETKDELIIKIREIDYKNLILIMSLNDIRNDLSINLIKRDSDKLNNLVVLTNIVYLTSVRISSEINNVMFFDFLKKEDKRLLKKEFDLFYEFSEKIE
jgi:hypothetical protein